MNRMIQTTAQETKVPDREDFTPPTEKHELLSHGRSYGSGIMSALKCIMSWSEGRWAVLRLKFYPFGDSMRTKPYTWTRSNYPPSSTDISTSQTLGIIPTRSYNDDAGQFCAGDKYTLQGAFKHGFFFVKTLVLVHTLRPRRTCKWVSFFQKRGEATAVVAAAPKTKHKKSQTRYTIIWAK